MKRISILCMAVLMSLCAFAEKGALVLYSPATFQVMSVSPNGKWACGIIGDGTYTLVQGMLVNIETGEFTYLSTIDKSTAFDVTDEGLVVGSYTDYEVTGNGIGTTVAGYYKDGQWHRLDNSTIEGVLDIEGEAHAVSADGRTIVGYVMDGPKDSDLAPAKWVDGKLALIYDHDETVGNVSTVSADGTRAAGWSYKKNDMNRITTIWAGDSTTYISEFSSAFEVGYRFSPDGNKLACNQWGYPYIYDMNTGTKQFLPTVAEEYWKFQISYVGNDGVVFGEEQSMGGYGQSYYGYVYDGEKPWKMHEWLKETYNVDIDQSKFMIAGGVDRSDDGKVIAAFGYLETGEWASVLIVFDQEVTYAKPVAVKAEKMHGLNSVRVTWNAPLMNAENVLGYNLYRDGKAVIEGTTDMAYIDANLAEGTYSYTVAAIYEDEKGELCYSEQSAAAVVEVAPDALNQAFNIQYLCVNYNDLKLRWSAPESNLPTATYFDPQKQLSGFGGGVMSFSVAICLPYDIVNNYAEHYSIARVAFMPRNVEALYTIKIYVNDAEVASQLVDNTTLRYNDMNVVDLTQPVSVKANDKVLVAIDVDASKFNIASNDVIGANYGYVVTGYSDLLRQATEADYYSLNQSSINAGYGEMPMSWAITAIFAPVAEDGKADLAWDEVVGYDVYRNDELVGSSQTANFFDKGLTAGNQTYGIVAKYADGRSSEPAVKTVRFTPNEDALLPVDDLKVCSDLTFVEASWEAPLNNDTRVVSYAQGTSSGKGMRMAGATELIEYTVAHEYPYTYLEWYTGYNIDAIRFYPSSEATFAVAIEEDGVDLEFIVLGEMGAEDGYTLNTWNNVKLENPVKIKAGSTYRIKLLCSEVDPSTYPICVDNGVGEIGVTDLYSWDYASYSSAISDGGLSGCWMIGMLISNDNNEPLPVEAYKVIIDGDSDNADVVTETTYRKDGLNWNDQETHRIRVNTVYEIDGGTIEVDGAQQIFKVKAGVESIEVNRVSVYPNPATSFIKVDGDVEKLVLIDMAGRAVAETNATTLDVTSLPVGNYLLNIYNNGSVSTVKVLIVR